MKGTRFGRYELVRKIAAGGMAEVFLARQWGEGGFFRDVVIKRLFRHLAEHPRTLEMFQIEAKLLAELSHPNIPQVYELGREQGTWYIAMEWVDGHTVTDCVRVAGRQGMAIPHNVAIGIVLQLCEALHHAHERRDRAGKPLRIVHRDVTPENVMVTRDGVVKLMDFGVAATAARRDTDAGTVKGTFSYMAPEQVRGRPLDKRADVFALGVILYELTTGTRLFRGSDVQVMTQIVEQDAPPPSTRVPDFSPELEAIVMRALVRDRAHRVPSAAHLAAALEEYCVRAAISAGPRALARFVGQVFPYERERDQTLGLVPEATDTTAQEVAPPSENLPEGGGWEVFVPHEALRHEALDVTVDDPTIHHELDLLAPPEDEPTTSDGEGPHTLPPEALDRLLAEEEISLEPHVPPDPVVLLERRRPSEPPNEYVRALERRLDEEE
ncbi:MAG: serine/threonine protein kinase [Myxococcota bacterium]|nr:serine/threonine protein kinase [Myxococcota bacterium]MDW8362049.1 serine/threonine-protein kinase [Myxococcales bacterium]